MSAEDLASFEPEWVDPISIDYRGWKVYQLPPNGQGVGTLEMLTILREFPVAGSDPAGPDAFHWKIEAQKLSFQDLKRWIGDPRFSTVPTANLLSSAYARNRAAEISNDRANCTPQAGTPGKGMETPYISPW